MFKLILLFWILTSSSCHSVVLSGYTVTPLDQAPGLVYEDLDNVHLIQLFCRIVRYLDIQDYETQFDIIESNLAENDIRLG